MRCTICYKPAVQKCGECASLYCSEQCFTRDHHELIGLKRKPDDEQGQQQQQKKERGTICGDDDRDPINLEEFEGMDRRDIVILDGRCFHLPSIYNWVISRGKERNPRTNLPFAAQDIIRLQYTAQERYPLEVRVAEINGRTRTENATSLMTVEQLLIRLYSISEYAQPTTLFQVATELTRRGDNFTMRLGADNRVDFIDAASRHANEQIFTLIGNDETMLKVYLLHSATPPTLVERMTRIIALAQDRGWPTQLFEERRRDARRYIEQAAEAQRRAEAMRRDIPRAPVPTAEDDENRPVGSIKVGISLNLQEGNARGIDYFYVIPNATLLEVQQMLRLRLAPIIAAVNRPGMRFIYAGRFLQNNVTLGSVDRFQDGNVLFATW